MLSVCTPSTPIQEPKSPETPPSPTSPLSTASTESKSTEYSLRTIIWKKIRYLCTTHDFDNAPFPFLVLSEQEIKQKFSAFQKATFALSSPDSSKKYFVINLVNMQPKITKLMLFEQGRYANFGMVADVFFQKERVKAKRSDMVLSPEEMWRNIAVRDYLLQLVRQMDTPLRQILWTYTKQCAIFEVTSVKALLSYYKARHVLDPCAGWGDRLVGALATPNVESYTGIDINSALRPLYLQLLETLLPDKKVSIYFQNFLHWETEVKINGKPGSPSKCAPFDTVLACPPFWNLERYSQEEKRDLPTWIQEFLVPLVCKCMSLLTTGGIFMLAMNDYSGKQFGYTKQAVETALKYSRLIDVVGQFAKIYQKKEEVAVIPIWIFKKF